MYLSLKKWPVGSEFSTGKGRGLTGADGVTGPCIKSESPCGTVASRTTVAGCCGAVVAGTFSHMPVSMCRAALVTASLTCCR